jgi:hypothetical protein
VTQVYRQQLDAVLGSAFVSVGLDPSLQGIPRYSDIPSDTHRRQYPRCEILIDGGSADVKQFAGFSGC